jgi:hypothetical protein
MKGAIVAALGGFQNLDSDEARERPIDRIAAMGAAQIARAEECEQEAIICSLGVDLIRFKFAGVERAEADAQDQLAGILAWVRWWKPFPVPGARDLDVVATWAVHEWRNDKCPQRPKGCGGALEVPAHDGVDGAQRMQVCPICRGTGLRRWSDQERLEGMGQAFDQAMSRAHAIIHYAESLALRRGKEQTERWNR